MGPMQLKRRLEFTCQKPCILGVKIAFLVVGFNFFRKYFTFYWKKNDKTKCLEYELECKEQGRAYEP